MSENEYLGILEEKIINKRLDEFIDEFTNRLESVVELFKPYFIVMDKQKLTLMIERSVSAVCSVRQMSRDDLPILLKSELSKEAVEHFFNKLENHGELDLGLEKRKQTSDKEKDLEDIDDKILKLADCDLNEELDEAISCALTIYNMLIIHKHKYFNS